MFGWPFACWRGSAATPHESNPEGQEEAHDPAHRHPQTVAHNPPAVHVRFDPEDGPLPHFPPFRPGRTLPPWASGGAGAGDEAR